MGPWNTSGSDNTVSREDAIKKVQEMAKDQGIRGSFKVFFEDRLIPNPNDLPERVDMSKVKVSATLDNA